MHLLITETVAPAKRLIAWLIVISPYALAGEKQLSLWKQFVNRRELEDSIVNSIEVHYHFTFRAGLKESPQMDLSKECRFGREFNKYYHQEALKDNIGGRSHKREIAYNGTLFFRRETEMPNVLFVSHTSKELPTPPPTQLVEIYPPKFLDEALENGLVRLMDALETEYNGVPCVKFVFDITENNIVQRYEVVYDQEHGCLPVESKRYDSLEGGNVIDEIVGVKLHAVRVDGNEYYYPIEAHRYMYHEGAEVLSQSFTVTPNSIIINADLPDINFSLTPHSEDEYVYDTDLQMTLRDPGKDMDALMDAMQRSHNAPRARKHDDIMKNLTTEEKSGEVPLSLDTHEAEAMHNNYDKSTGIKKRGFIGLFVLLLFISTSVAVFIKRKSRFCDRQLRGS